ncbi:MAG: DHH family phosphoesterase [Deltaproteobacteria bacterium]|nr:DHH family phosphoesterase [Deltaproteobacteria bacterium]
MAISKLEGSLTTISEGQSDNRIDLSSSSREYYKLKGLLEKERGNSHLIILQGTPDPDAISSAMALGFLGMPYGIEATVLCFMAVSHQENRALVKKLGIKLTVYEQGFDFANYDIYSIVDSQKPSTPVDKQLREEGVRFFAFIDHHRPDPAGVPYASFVDIRDDAASTAGIMTSYIEQAYPAGLDLGDPEQVIMATALMHGIRSDTHKFIRASLLDHQAASYLFPSVAHQTIELIERKILTAAMLEMLEQALVNRKAIDNIIYSDVGFVRAIDRDGIPQAAELLVTREGIDTALVWGIVDEKFIDGSFRTRSEMINPDEFLKGCLGISPQNGEYYGGGNSRDKGGFQIPLGFLSQFDDKEQVYAMAKTIIERSLLDYIGKASETDR